jgi:hypothetical protein
MKDNIANRTRRIITIGIAAMTNIQFWFEEGDTDPVEFDLLFTDIGGEARRQKFRYNPARRNVDHLGSINLQD